MQFNFRYLYMNQDKYQTLSRITKSNKIGIKTLVQGPTELLFGPQYL